MNKDVKEIVKSINTIKEYVGSPYITLETKKIDLLLDYINQLETIINELIEWKDKNGNRYIYQDSLGEDWYFYDLDAFDELGEILDKVGNSNE